MADADEDAIPASSHASHPDEGDDIEDETQDYRFLNSLTTSRTTTNTVPKRGTKDFEPNPTRAQTNALDASREAMHNALSAIRVHAGGKNHNVGIYVGEREKQRDQRFRVQFDSEEEDSRCVVICRFRSTHSRAMGRADRRGWTWLLPEEAIYLIERGSLDIRWCDVDGGLQEATPQAPSEDQTSSDLLDAEDDQEPEPGELPMSLQGAYATFIGRDGLTLERYMVYAGLKRAGYIVRRNTSTWHDNQDRQTNGHGSMPAEVSDTASTSTSTLIPSSKTAQSPISQPTLIQRLLSWLINPTRQPSCPAFGPLLAPGLYRNYNDVFRSLALISYHESPNTFTPVSPPQSSPKPPFTIAFNVWKSTPDFRKSSPPPPSYYICVVDARSSSVPTASQIGDLLDSMPYSPLENESEKRIEARIKHGKRNVIVAVVDMGVVSYLRFSESESGSGRLFENKTKNTRGKGGGWRRGGGGRGGRGGGKR